MRFGRLILAAAALAPANAAVAQTVACDVKLNVTDQDPAGLNVRVSPGGAVVAALKAKDRWVQVQVTGQDGTWARISKATSISEDDAGGTVIWKGDGWVAFSKLGIEELNTQARILAAPTDTARAVAQLSGTDELQLARPSILGCSRAYLQVRLHVMDRSTITGWTQNFCSNRFTTCV
jgi:hypothetical protein